MKRSTKTYITLTAVAGALLWGILALGERLEAPPHLAGVYDVYWEWGIIPPRGQRLPREIQIEQSGVFVTVTANDQILSRGQLRRADGPGEGTPGYAYVRDSVGWPLDIYEVSSKRLVVALAHRRGYATRDKTAPRPARPAPGTSPSTIPTTNRTSVQKAAATP
jgi:hypothetical protein